MTNTTDTTDTTALVDNDSLASIGFDTQSPGLETITDPVVRIRILRSFRDEHRSTPAEVRDSIVYGDRTRARELLHKLMGSTATIGLPVMRKTVIDLHTSIHESPDSVPPEHLTAFEDEVVRVVDALTVLGEPATSA